MDPAFPISHMPTETVVTVRGLARPGAPTTPTPAPLSGRACVAWEVLVLRRDLRTLGGDGDDQEIVHRLASQGHFLLDDGTGLAAAFLGGAEVLGTHAEDIPTDSQLAEFLRVRGLALPLPDAERVLLCTESIVPPDGQVEITGWVEWDTIGVTRRLTFGGRGPRDRRYPHASDNSSSAPASATASPAPSPAPSSAPPPVPRVTTIGAAEDGMYAEIAGLVSGQPRVAPLSGRPCLAWGLSVIGHAVQSLGGDGDDWSEVMQRTAGDSILVADDTGWAWVSLAGAGLRLAERRSYVLTDVLPRNALTALGVPVVDLEAGGLNLRAYETILVAGARVTVTGVAMWETDPDPTRASYRDMPRRLALRSTATLPVVLTVP